MRDGQTLYAPFVGAAPVSASARSCGGQHTLAVKGLGSSGRWEGTSASPGSHLVAPLCAERCRYPRHQSADPPLPCLPRSCSQHGLSHVPELMPDRDGKHLSLQLHTRAEKPGIYSTHCLACSHFAEGITRHTKPERFRTGSAHRLHLL